MRLCGRLPSGGHHRSRGLLRRGRCRQLLFNHCTIRLTRFLTRWQCLPALQRKKQRHFEENDYVVLTLLSPASDAVFPSPDDDDEDAPLVDSPPAPDLSIREILTPGVRVAIANYATISILDIARAALMPLFYATPIEVGGLGLTPETIGLLLGGYVRDIKIFSRFHAALI